MYKTSLFWRYKIIFPEKQIALLLKLGLYSSILNDCILNHLVERSGPIKLDLVILEVRCAVTPRKAVKTNQQIHTRL
jgi:hypothetical protein